MTLAISPKVLAVTVDALYSETRRRILSQRSAIERAKAEVGVTELRLARMDRELRRLLDIEQGVMNIFRQIGGSRSEVTVIEIEAHIEAQQAYWAGAENSPKAETWMDTINHAKKSLEKLKAAIYELAEAINAASC